MKEIKDHGESLWGTRGFRFDGCRDIWLGCRIDERCKWNRHDAEWFGLEKLHGSSHVFFHEFNYLPFCFHIWPLFPNLMVQTSFHCFILIFENQIELEEWRLWTYMHTCACLKLLYGKVVLKLVKDISLQYLNRLQGDVCNKLCDCTSSS